MTEKQAGAAAEVEVIYSADSIAARIEELAEEIAARGLERPLVIPVLKGSFVFAADLIRALHRWGVEPEVDFLVLASYRKSRIMSAEVEILRDLDLRVEDRNVLILQDVLNSGRTLAFANDLLAARGAREILSCVLLTKDVPRAVNVAPTFSAFSCGEAYLVGYGMDVAHRYRELPFIGRVAGSQGES
jgi:hypoxanthine phosphoribosyltransferase